MFVSFDFFFNVINEFDILKSDLVRFQGLKEIFMTFGILFNVFVQFFFVNFMQIKFLTQCITNLLNCLTFVNNGLKIIVRIAFNFIIGGLDDFLYITENVNDLEVRLGFVFGRFSVLKNGLVEIGELDDKRGERVNEDFIVYLINAFHNLEILFNSLIEWQGHNGCLLIAFDGRNEALNFYHGF